MSRPRVGCRSPDWYLVPDVPALLNGELRRSYVLWMELVPPLLLVEYASGNGAKERDRTPREGKFWIYERRIRPDYYAIYEPERGRLELHRLAGGRFEAMTPNERGHFPIAALGVELGLWQGRFRDFDLPWVRCWDKNGQLLPSIDERLGLVTWEKQQAQLWADQARQQAERERLEKEQAQVQAARERLEKEQVQVQAERERLEKEQAQVQAERERLEKEKAQHRIERLREQLRALGVEPENGE